MMDDETEAVGYYDMEVLAVDVVKSSVDHTLRIGLSLADEDGDQVDIAVSARDAERLVLLLARAVYDVRADMGD
jgi:hypothetical protein